MSSLRRYLRLFAVQVKMSLAVGMQYRFDFLVQGFGSLFTMVITLVPLFVVFGSRPKVIGWSFEQALVVTGWFVALKGLLEGAITPSLTGVVEMIRKGTLDFVLLKPADAQFLVSTTRFQPWCVFDLGGGALVIGIAFARMHLLPTALHVLAGVALLGAAIAILYSIWILVISLAFLVVKIDNLAFLFQSVFDAARWPITVFPKALRLVFTFVLPLALMTSYPAMAVLGTLGAGKVVASIVGAAVFAWVARQVWSASIRRYTSASS